MPRPCPCHLRSLRPSPEGLVPSSQRWTLTFRTSACLWALLLTGGLRQGWCPKGQTLGLWPAEQHGLIGPWEPLRGRWEVGHPSQGPGPQGRPRLQNPAVGAAGCGPCGERPSLLSRGPGSGHRPTDHRAAQGGLDRSGQLLPRGHDPDLWGGGSQRGQRRVLSSGRAGSHAVGTGHSHLCQVRLWVACPPKPIGTELPPRSGSCTS